MGTYLIAAGGLPYSSGLTEDVDGLRLSTATVGAVGTQGFSGSIGNGTDTSITVTHNLGLWNVVIGVYRNASPWETIKCSVRKTTVNSLILTFATAPATNAYRVVILPLIQDPGSVYVEDYATPQLAADAAEGKRLVFPASQTFTVTSLSLPANCYVEGNNATLKFPDSSTATGSQADEIIKVNGSGITITNLNFDGRSANQGATYSPNRHCVRVEGAFSDTLISLCDFTNIIGDGVYVHTQDSENTSIQNCTFTANYDNHSGVTVVSGSNVILDTNTFTNMAKPAYPGAISIEPSNYWDYCRDIFVSDNTIVGGSGTPGDSVESGVSFTNTVNCAVKNLQITGTDISGTHINAAVNIVGNSSGPLSRVRDIVIDSNNIHNMAATGKAVRIADFIQCTSISNNTFNGMQDAVHNTSGSTVLTTITGNTYTGVTNNLTNVTPNNATNVVTDYSADNTGVADCTTAFQNALTALGTATKGYLYVPPGTYRFDSTLEIKSPGNITVSAYGATLRRGDGSGGFTIFRNYTGSTNYPVNTGPGNLTFFGGTYDLNATTNENGAQAISIAHSHDLLIEDVTVQNVLSAHGIEVNSTDTAEVRNCTFKGFILGTNNTNQALQIDGAFSSGTIGSQPWDLTPCHNVLVTGCVNDEYNGLQAWPCLAGSHTARETDPHTNISFINNTINKATHYGLQVMNYRGFTITGNVFTECNGGIEMTIGDQNDPPGAGQYLNDDGLISGNTFTNMGHTPYGWAGPMTSVILCEGQPAPYSESGDIVIQNNTVSGYRNYYGIYGTRGKNITVSGNSFVEPFFTDQYPVVFRNSDILTITNNTITAGHATPIDTTGCTNVTNTGNSTAVVSTVDEEMPVLSYAEDTVDRTNTSTTYGDVAMLSANIVCPASRKVLIIIQTRQSTTSNYALTSFQINEGANVVRAPEDDGMIQGDNTTARTFTMQYVADFSSLDGGSVIAGDTVTVTLKHRQSGGGTGTYYFRSLSLVAGG